MSHRMPSSIRRGTCVYMVVQSKCKLASYEIYWTLRSLSDQLDLASYVHRNHTHYWSRATYTSTKVTHQLSYPVQIYSRSNIQTSWSLCHLAYINWCRHCTVYNFQIQRQKLVLVVMCNVFQCGFSVTNIWRFKPVIVAKLLRKKTMHILIWMCAPLRSICAFALSSTQPVVMRQIHGTNLSHLIWSCFGTYNIYMQYLHTCDLDRSNTVVRRRASVPDHCVLRRAWRSSKFVKYQRTAIFDKKKEHAEEEGRHGRLWSLINLQRIRVVSVFKLPSFVCLPEKRVYFMCYPNHGQITTTMHCALNAVKNGNDEEICTTSRCAAGVRGQIRAVAYQMYNVRLCFVYTLYLYSTRTMHEYIYCICMYLRHRIAERRTSEKGWRTVWLIRMILDVAAVVA